MGERPLFTIRRRCLSVRLWRKADVPPLSPLSPERKHLVKLVRRANPTLVHSRKLVARPLIVVCVASGRQQEGLLLSCLVLRHGSESYLAGREREMGSAAYQAQFQQSPVPAEGNIIKREWICSYKTLPDLSTGRVFQSLDTAHKTAPSNDYSALTTWLWVGNKFYLLDLVRERLDYPQLKAMIISKHDEYRPERVLIEDAGAGIALTQDLRVARGDMVIVPIKAKEPKEVRVSAVSALFENKQVLFPAEAPWLDQCEREVLGFPAAKHDDIIDSIAQFLNWVRGQQGTGFFECYWPDRDPSQLHKARGQQLARLPVRPAAPRDSRAADGRIT